MKGQERAMWDAMAALSDQITQLYDERTSLTDPIIVERSRQLDNLVVAWYRHHTSERSRRHD